MSVIIRQQLQFLLASLSDDISRGAGLENLPNEPSSLEPVSTLSETLARKLAQVHELLREWTHILASPDPDIRTLENGLFTDFLVRGESPGQISASGSGLQTKLDLKIDRIRAQLPSAPSNGGYQTPPVRPLINLPALQLPDFDGVEGNWPSFWAAFSHTIHNNPSLDGSQKLTYLVGRLRGSARTLVDGFSLTDNNYDIVVDLLKSRYGDDAKRADRLRSELFHLTKPTGHSTSLRAFSEHVDRICRQLESLGNNLDNNPFLTVAIKEKLPTDIKAQLYDKEMEGGRAWTSKEWRERLARVVRLREAVHAPWENPQAPVHIQTPKSFPSRPNEPIRRAFPVVGELHKTSGGGRECSLCLRDGHKPSNCTTYRTVQQRINRLAEQGRCSLCAREGHRREVCSSSARCFGCGGRHHLLVCPTPNNTPARGSNTVSLGTRMMGEGPKSPPGNSLISRRNDESGQTNSQIASAVAEREAPADFTKLYPGGQPRSTAYLMIREIAIFSNNGSNPVSVPVFFDPGSQPSFISSDLVSIINPELLTIENMAVGGFSGNSAPKTMRFTSPRFLIRLRRKDGGWEAVELNQTGKIVPPVEFLKEVCWQPAEPVKMGVTVGEPQILLGVREFWKFFTGKREVLPGLFRVETVFGPVFGGELTLPQPVKSLPITCAPCVCGTTVERAKPEELIKQLWSLESIGITDPLDVNDDALAIALFRDSVNFKEGRYEVGWPWRPGGRDRLPDNFSLAYSRLSALSRRLLVNPELREKYQETISDQISRGIIEPADRTGSREHYIPHQAVVTPKKLRVVYDASAHEKGKPSLNELLLPGPNLVPELAGILLRFRATAYPVLGDIEKAFLAVGLLEEDREVAKFLWLKDPSRPLTAENLAIFRFKRIAFGVNSSPFLLASVLQHHLSSSEDSLSMSRNFYVDNLLLCNESVDEAVISVQTARQVMSQAGMRLREFVSSDPSILSFLPLDEVLVGDVQKVLGISWSLPGDELIFELPKVNDFPPTRRGILGAIASLFDPLGLCSPCLVKAKIFFQSLWSLGKGWDEPIGEEYERQWSAITSEWNGTRLTFARQTPCSQASLQLHIFSDAGPNAFATAVYLRAEWDNRSEISLLFAKSRLRPKSFKSDGLTIPRLELLGLVAAVRAKNFVIKNFDRPFEKVFFWVDSQIVLSWLASNAHQPVFIENRLSEVRKEKGAIFRYVRSSDNPADLGTRGTFTNEFCGLRLWNFGPNWLKLPEKEWPNEFRDIIPFTGEPKAFEGNSSPLLTVTLAEPLVVPTILNPRNFRSWSKLLITTTFILYFLVKTFGRSQKFRQRLAHFTNLEGVEPSSAGARLLAKKWLIKREQTEMSLETNTTFMGGDGLIRLRTRLANAHQPADFKNPMVLPRDSWVTRLLILSAHKSLAHAGVNYTLTKFLSEFWCVRARRLVKSVLRDCMVCKKDKAVKFSLPPMPPLPTVRTTPSPPFTFVGLDYLGPTQYKSLEGPKKAWILLFTCLSCRAVHLELVDSLSATDFLAAFRRFVARRGTPKRVWSDNGTQLVLGRQLLMAYYDLPVEWKLIPPHSPWAGGVYERMVGLVKTAFRRSLGRSLSTWVQLQTLTHEIEAILNGRPITFVSDEKTDPLPLRPLDFLSPHSQNYIIEPDEPDKPFQPSSSEKLAHLWYVTNDALRRFWQIWSREYLVILRGRTKDTHVGPRVFAPDSPKVGDIVLIEQQEFPRNHWPLGRIISLLPPGKPRSAKVRLGTGKEWERPVNQLVPLEGSQSAEWTEISVLPSPRIGNRRGGGLAKENVRGGKKKGSMPFRWADHPPVEPSPPAGKGVPPKYNWARRPPLVAVVLVLLSLVKGMSAIPSPLTCADQGIWVFLNPKAEGALVCCEGICSSRAHSTPYLLPLPSDVLASGFECHVSYSIMGERISSQINCDPVEGCNLIKCFFCWERVLNPQCSPFLLPMLFGTIVGAVGILFILGFCFLGNLVRGGLRIFWLRFRLRFFQRAEPSAEWRRRPTVVEHESEDEGEILFHREGPAGRTPSPTTSRSCRAHSKNHPPGDEADKPRRLTRLGYALAPHLFCGIIAVLFISVVNAGLDVMSISADTEECLVDQSGTKCRFDSVTSLTLLPVGQRVQLVFHTPHSVPMGSLYFVLKGLSLRCVKESLGWTRSYRLNISSILRCPAAGSCVGSFCSDMGVHQYVPELGEQFPGLNFCREASGFVRRGCFSPAYACLFYRIFAEPISPFVYELIKCPTWQFLLNLELTLELEGMSYKEDLILLPGISHFWQISNLSLTFSPGGLPPFPILGGIFLVNRTHAALVPERQFHLWCASYLSAESLNCSLSMDACTECYTHHEDAVVQCQCRRPSNIERTMGNPLKRLPNTFGQLSVSHTEGKIWSVLPYSPINLMLKMGGTSLAVRHTSSKCTVRPGRLMGCHSCRTGGRFNHSCTSSRGDSFASISCTDGTMWVTRCSPNGHPNSVVLSWAHPKVATRCKVDCLGGETYFQLEGILIFLMIREGDNLPINSAYGGRGNYTGGITFPQIKFALFQSVGSLPQASLAIAACLGWILLFLLAFRYCPISGWLACCCPQTIAGTLVEGGRVGTGTEQPRERHIPEPTSRGRTM